MSALTDALAVVVIAGFLASAFLQGREKRGGVGTWLAAASWVTFGIFWALLVPHFAFVQQSPIEGVLSAVAVPASGYVAYLIWTGKRDFETMTRAVAIMGVIYMPFMASTTIQRLSIEMVAVHTDRLLGLAGFEPSIVAGPDGFQSTFEYVGPDGHPFATRVVLACTGIGSIATVSGLIMSLDAPLERRLLGVGFAVPVIYGLNVIRVAFIVYAQHRQWFAGFRDSVFLAFGTSDPNMVSYLVADRVIAQSLSVVALVGLTLALMRLLPEIATIVEDVLFLLTGEEYDVRSVL